MLFWQFRICVCVCFDTTCFNSTCTESDGEKLIHKNTIGVRTTCCKHKSRNRQTAVGQTLLPHFVDNAVMSAIWEMPKLQNLYPDARTAPTCTFVILPIFTLASRPTVSHATTPRTQKSTRWTTFARVFCLVSLTCKHCFQKLAGCISNHRTCNFG